MALRTILQQGDPSLEKTSREVTNFDDRLHTLLDDMRETMREANGVGLAAPQVGVLRRVALVLDIQVMETENADEPVFTETLIEFINPVILKADGEQTGLEGCLSIPGVQGNVTRPNRVKVRAQDRHGAFFEVESTDFTARVICHEFDHLDGKLYSRLCDELFDVNNLPEESE